MVTVQCTTSTLGEKTATATCSSARSSLILLLLLRHRERERDRRRGHAVRCMAQRFFPSTTQLVYTRLNRSRVASLLYILFPTTGRVDVCYSERNYRRERTV